MSIILPPEQHKHSLPRFWEQRYPLRTLVQCEKCDDWFWMRAGDWGPYWQPLRWYNWRLRRVVDATEPLPHRLQGNIMTDNNLLAAFKREHVWRHEAEVERDTALAERDTFRDSLANAESITNSMSHFADVADQVERRNNELVAERDAAIADRKALVDRVRELLADYADSMPVQIEDCLLNLLATNPDAASGEAGA